MGRVAEGRQFVVTAHLERSTTISRTLAVLNGVQGDILISNSGYFALSYLIRPNFSPYYHNARQR